MRNSLLSGMTPGRLRLGLSLFFLALALPTALLIYQAYSQLKWEAFHQHRVMAEELALRIDRELQQRINVEEARSFTDYSFLNVAGGNEVNFIQRSPLSAFPLTSELPGLIGYFQIDSEGTFTTPLLPQQLNASVLYGISREERNARQQLQATLQEILSANRLVSSAEQARRRARIATEERPQPQRQKEEARVMMEREVPMEMATEEDSSLLSGLFGNEESAPTAMAPEPATAPSEALDEAQGMEPQVMSQAAFDRLSEPQKDFDVRQQKAISNKLGRVEDLKLDSPYGERAMAEKKLKMRAKPTTTSRGMRKESNVLPREELAFNDAVEAEQTVPAQRITTFESEIDPFELRQLDSGHFVLFRKVWRNGQRYIQGALIEREPFFNGLFEPLFRETALSQMSSLAIAYNGDIFSAFASNDSPRYLSSGSEMRGALLHQARLSAPLSELELIFSIERLPAGPGGRIIAWLSAILTLVLCGGLYLLYRLGLGQLTLARQQQDFVSAVSHELKTPLTSIRMYGEMLREGWGSEEKKRSYYDYIYTESERLSRLINNVLQLARMTRNELHIELHPVKVGELIDMLRSKVQSQIEQAGFTLNLECDETVSEQVLEVDADGFTQILINLVDNAIKFSAKAEQKQLDISCHATAKGGVLFTVRDYGPGIARDQMKKIFKLFYRSENELTRETVGTGIGLSLVRQLAASMHAEVDVINKEPGAEFRLTFPRLKD